MEPYLKALLEAMKTKPKSEERTITYYPEAVELKLTKVDVERMQRQARADAMFAEIDTDDDV